MEVLKKALLAVVSVVLFVTVAGAYPPTGGNPQVGLTQGGRVVINEVLASNVECFADAKGEYDDWVELYNPGETPIDVGGMYLTDNVAEPAKWQFPTGSSSLTTIAAHGYLLIWVDKDVANRDFTQRFRSIPAARSLPWSIRTASRSSTVLPSASSRRTSRTAGSPTGPTPGGSWPSPRRADRTSASMKDSSTRRR